MFNPTKLKNIILFCYCLYLFFLEIKTFSEHINWHKTIHTTVLCVNFVCPREIDTNCFHLGNFCLIEHSCIVTKLLNAVTTHYRLIGIITGLGELWYSCAALVLLFSWDISASVNCVWISACVSNNPYPQMDWSSLRLYSLVI